MGKSSEQRESDLDTGQALLVALRACGEPARLRILRLLREREHCVCDLTEFLGLDQSTVSHHLNILKRARLVRGRRDPDDTRWIYYSIDRDQAAWLSRFVSDFLDTSDTDTTPASCLTRPTRQNACCRGERDEQRV